MPGERVRFSIYKLVTLPKAVWIEVVLREKFTVSKLLLRFELYLTIQFAPKSYGNELLSANCMEFVVYEKLEEQFIEYIMNANTHKSIFIIIFHHC